MADTTRGAGRVRSWPRPRKKGGTKEQVANQNKFMNAQRATKYFAPQMYQYFMEQVEGSPLLPRDVMTMMLYNRLYAFQLENGKVLWPMPAYQDVSQSLDVITNTPGQTIVRGPTGWEPTVAPGPDLATRWKILFDQTIDVPVPELVIKLGAGWNDLSCTIENVGSSISGTRAMQLSTDSGATFWNTSGNYRFIADSGTSTAVALIHFFGAASSAGRSGTNTITGNSSGCPPIVTLQNRNSGMEYFDATLDPINALRIYNDAGGNLVGGRVRIMGR